jgi:hypothetical protein
MKRDPTWTMCIREDRDWGLVVEWFDPQSNLRERLWTDGTRWKFSAAGFCVYFADETGKEVLGGSIQG